MTPILVFDLETVPDAAGLRRLHPDWAALSDAEVAAQAFAARRERTGGSDFLPLHQHRIIAIGCAFRDDSGFRVRCLGTAHDGEARLIADFFRLVDRYTPQLVSWNGGGFDLPVLHYRGLVHGIQATRYWENGDDDRDFRYNNYTSRYHARHTDLMDVLAMYQGRAAAPLDELSRLCGFAGKLGMSGDQVWDAYQAGAIDAIRNYCETDVVNTYLLYCRFQRMRGHMSDSAYAAEMCLVREALVAAGAAEGAAHWTQYLAAWPADEALPPPGPAAGPGTEAAGNATASGAR
jgi:predicted PolB exonuclease-like 3'-5' exonuclease